MIPKIIHFCWLSNDPFPDDVKVCMLSWKKYLPDYEILHWNFNKFDKDSSVWVKQAFESKKYAFAADYIRLYALYNYGGIYLDTDVEVLKSFDDLLNLPYFVGKENSDYGIEAAIIGAEKNCFWIGKCLDHYKNRKFVKGVGLFDIAVLPSILRRNIEENFKLIFIDNLSEFINDSLTVCVLPVDYFSPKTFDTKEIFKTQNTYCIHHFSGSWKKNRTFFESVRLNLSQVAVKIGFYKIYKLIKSVFKT